MLKQVGDGLKWEGGPVYRGPNKKRSAIRWAIRKLGVDAVREALGDAVEHVDSSTLKAAASEISVYEHAVAKISPVGDRWKIRGVATLFDSFEAAVDFQYGDGEEST